MTNPLDRFIPVSDVRERHSTRVKAPAPIVFDAARAFDLQSVPLIRGIIRLRQLVLGSQGVERQPRPFLDEAFAMGWGVLASEPGRLVVAGALCQPWLADVVFKPVPAESFAQDTEPNHVKIAWTLEIDSLTPTSTRLSTETRAAATDSEARARFRSYWRWARFGIIAIRWLMLPAIRRQSERAWQQTLR